MQIETKRLSIRNLQAADWMALKSISEDFKKSKYSVYDMPLPSEDEKVKSLCTQFAASNLWFSVLSADRMIGYICFHEERGIYDLGFCFHSDHHGKGYAFESCMATMDFIVKERTVKAFTAGTALCNTPSCILLKKLGFVCVSTQTVSFSNDFSFEGGNFALSVK